MDELLRTAIWHLDHEELERWLEIVEKRDVYTAREWLEAVASGHEPADNYCIKESAFFSRVAVVSWAVGRWRTHDKSYIQRAAGAVPRGSRLVLKSHHSA